MFWHWQSPSTSPLPFLKESSRFLKVFDGVIVNAECCLMEHFCLWASTRSLNVEYWSSDLQCKAALVLLAHLCMCLSNELHSDCSLRKWAPSESKRWWKTSVKGKKKPNKSNNKETCVIQLGLDSSTLMACCKKECYSLGVPKLMHTRAFWLVLLFLITWDLHLQSLLPIFLLSRIAVSGEASQCIKCDFGLWCSIFQASAALGYYISQLAVHWVR